MVTSISLSTQLVQEGMIFLLASLLLVRAWEHYQRGRAHRTGWSSRRLHLHTINVNHQQKPKAWPTLQPQWGHLADVVAGCSLGALIYICKEHTTDRSLRLLKK